MITRKKFNRVLNETIKDFEAVNHNDFAKQLKDILNAENIRDLTLPQVSPLIELILSNSPLRMIQKEYKIMRAYLHSFFDFGALDNGLIYINKKGANHE